MRDIRNLLLIPFAIACSGNGLSNPTDTDSPTEGFDIETLTAGLHESATRYVAEAGDRTQPMETNDDSRPGFGENYATPFNTVLTPVGPDFHINHFYSQLQAFSHDNRYVMVSEDQPGTPSAMTVVRSLPNFDMVLEQPVGVWGNPRWSPADPNQLVQFVESVEAGHSTQ